MNHYYLNPDWNILWHSLTFWPNSSSHYLPHLLQTIHLQPTTIEAILSTTFSHLLASTLDTYTWNIVISKYLQAVGSFFIAMSIALRTASTIFILSVSPTYNSTYTCRFFLLAIESKAGYETLSMQQVSHTRWLQVRSTKRSPLCTKLFWYTNDILKITETRYIHNDSIHGPYFHIINSQCNPVLCHYMCGTKAPKILYSLQTKLV